MLYNFIKRAFDIVFSLLVLILSSWLSLIVAIAIKIDSKGPVIFSQERVGLNGKRFKFYKFRSMVDGAEALRDSLEAKNEMKGAAFKIKQDPRITRVGKFIRKTGIDELPQFVNVLKGDMSVVGPRPPLPREVEKYNDKMLRRLSVKGGLTCIWQTKPKRNNYSFDEIIGMDLEYIEKRSLLLDLKIIIKTVFALLRFDGE